MITQKINLKILVLAAAASLGLVASAAAQSMPAAASAGGGLLGQNYVGGEYTYVHYNQGAPQFARDYSLPLQPGVDDRPRYWRELRSPPSHRGRSGIPYQHREPRPDRLPGSGLGQALPRGKRGLDLGQQRFIQEELLRLCFHHGRRASRGIVRRRGAVRELLGGAQDRRRPRVGLRGKNQLPGISKEWSTSFTISINDEKDMGYAIGVNYHF
jgi:hypothetical protein